MASTFRTENSGQGDRAGTTYETANLLRVRSPPVSWPRHAAPALDDRLRGRRLADEWLRHDRSPGMDSKWLQGWPQLCPAAGARGRGMDPGQRSQGPEPTPATRRLVERIPGSHA